eukprot:TRINITY_DN13154_c2_g1_i1.p1 TRINITY_DN13154_c2_g1~~TRINITY_DN13154_c2_g1_i1.p1  ORF type:complete len:511 (+),score=68.58 TRINITY_DN13154_c2_g1_i1:101-1534(+)
MATTFATSAVFTRGLSTLGVAGDDAAASNTLKHRVSVLARWQDTFDVPVDTELCWNDAIPEALPESVDEPICVVKLRSPDSPVEFFEARLQRRHLQGQPEAWTSCRLERLMAAMAEPDRRGGNRDTVLLRREAGRMVIDVLFRGGSSDGPEGASEEGRVVEILNAYTTGTSPQTEATSLLRSLALAQRTHRRRIVEAQARLKEMYQDVNTMEARWTEACTDASKRWRDRLRRFALLLQAKVDKEQSLRAKSDELRLAAKNVAAAACEPPQHEECVGADAGMSFVRGAGRRGGRGKRGGAAIGRGGGAAREAAKRHRVMVERPAAESGLSSPEHDLASRAGPIATEVAAAMPLGAAVAGLGGAGVASASGTVAFPPPPPKQSLATAKPVSMSLFDPGSSDDEFFAPRSHHQGAHVSAATSHSAGAIPVTNFRVPAHVSRDRPSELLADSLVDGGSGVIARSAGPAERLADSLFHSDED